MTKDQALNKLHCQHRVIAVLDLQDIISLPIYLRRQRLEETLSTFYKPVYEPNDRIVFVIKHLDLDIAKMLQQCINQADISNFFCVLLLKRQSNIDLAKTIMAETSIDSVPIHVECFDDIDHSHDYNKIEPIKIDLDDLSNRQRYLLTESKTFCMYPWVHLHTYPTGDAWPCCHAEMKQGPVGSCKTQTLEQIWNADDMKKLRRDMLTEQQNALCARCYEQEDSGFFSGRQSANKHHGHHIRRIENTQEDGTYLDFQMTYWDIRFSNLCNLSCRSCGHIFSSSWYQDQIALAGPEWGKQHKALFYAGRTEIDMWEQLEPHLDYVEQIYFAGGEPLMMEEHYRILEELERRGRFDVRLIYNTNFTQVKLKNRYVFDYWRKFDSVAVGASLDAMGARAEYIRKGTNWSTVENNRRLMIDVCPDVDFYISPTLSIMNAWHLPDFHRDWVDRGLIRAQDLNVNILQDPFHYRIDIAPIEYKKQLHSKFEEHLEWLRPRDRLGRSSKGFESAINFMEATDNSHLIPKFWSKTHELDSIRKERLLDVIPELEILNADTAR